MRVDDPSAGYGCTHVGSRGHAELRLRRLRALLLLLLDTLGVERTAADDGIIEWDELAMGPESEDSPTTRRLHIGFAASSREHVDAFWQAGVDAGFRDDGAPGPRPEYGDDYYGGFLLDPDGNSAEAVHHGDVADRRGDRPPVDPRRRRRSGEAVLRDDRGRRRDQAQRRATRRAHFAGSGGTFSLVPGEPTVGLHMAFPAPTAQRSRRSTATAPAPVTATTAGPASGPSTTRATTARSCSTPTATTSRLSSTP